MKKILFFVAFLLPSICKAQVISPRETMGVGNQFESTFTCNSIQISSYSATSATTTATNVIYSTQTLWREIIIENRTNLGLNLYCGDSVFVSSQGTVGSTQTFAATTGFEIYPNSATNSIPFTTYVAPGQLFYCVNDSTWTSTVATICRGR